MDFDYVVMPAIILVVAFLLIWLSVRRARALSSKNYRMWRKVAERIILSVIVPLAFIVGGSSSFNAIRLCYVRATNPPAGAVYRVDGRKMHINCTGSGSPTIVLESGSGGDALVWGGVQPVLSRTTRVCSYDRAGLGWSEPRPGPRDADHIAGELHELLLQASAAAPIVLMGHSAGGIYMRDYAKHYPADIVGLVFVDSATPPAILSQTRKPHDHLSKIVTLLYRSAYILGFPRLLGYCSHPKPGFESHTGELQREDLCHTEYGPVFSELEGRDRSDEQTAHTGPYAALPILILSHDPAIRQLSLGNDDAWNQAQENLKKLSIRSRRIIAKDSGHYVQFDRPDLIEKEVPLFIEQIRGTAPQPTNYGSTITE